MYTCVYIIYIYTHIYGRRQAAVRGVAQDAAGAGRRLHHEQGARRHRGLGEDPEQHRPLGERYIM